jgi:SAM-dependent methyltransferase
LKRENVITSRQSIDEFSEFHEWATRKNPWGYDLVYCLGVLHHTPDPAASFRSIATLVKPGGMLCVWVYSRDMGAWTKVTDLYRKVTVHLPWPLLRAICLLAAPWDYVRRIPGIGKWIWGLFPCSTHPNWRWRVLDQFDWLSPVYQSKHTALEVKCWFIEAGFTDIEVLPFPVSVRGRRPVPLMKKAPRLIEAGLCRVYAQDV